MLQFFLSMKGSTTINYMRLICCWHEQIKNVFISKNNHKIKTKSIQKECTLSEYSIEELTVSFDFSLLRYIDFKFLLTLTQIVTKKFT